MTCVIRVVLVHDIIMFQGQVVLTTQVLSSISLHPCV